MFIIQLNFGISSTNISNTADISRYVCGPAHFYYISDDKKKNRYAENWYLEYPADLEVNSRPQSLKNVRYLEVKSINRLNIFTPSVCIFNLLRQISGLLN